MQFHRIDPTRDLVPLREFLAASDPDDYLLEEIEEWIHEDRLWVEEDDGVWVAFGRLHDLGDGEGWLSGGRVLASRRGKGLGRLLLEHLRSDARSIGLTELRGVVEDGNLASRHMLERIGFRAGMEMTLRRGLAQPGSAPPLHRSDPGVGLSGPVGWLPEQWGRVDLLPGSDGGRFGRWRPSLVERWSREGKLYVGPGLAAAVQVDWWTTPRTLWVNPLQGDPDVLLPALGSLTRALGHEEWQAFLPSGEEMRATYDRLGLLRHPFWGDRVHLYEWSEPSTQTPEPPG